MAVKLSSFSEKKIIGKLSSRPGPYLDVKRADIRTSSLLGVGLCAATLACSVDPDIDMSSPTQLGTASEDQLDELCPVLPAGVELIPGLVTRSAHERFGGLVITLSTRALACGEPALQHGQGGEGLGLTLGLPADMVELGPQPFAHASGIFVEWEGEQSSGAGGHGGFEGGVVELLSISDTCVTGVVRGIVADGGPFEGGFRAPRCEP